MKQVPQDLYGKFAATYDKTWEQYTGVTVGKMVKFMPKDLSGMSILDYGCGTGTLITQILHQHPDVQQIVGYDLSQSMLSITQAKLAGLPDNLQSKIKLTTNKDMITSESLYDVITSSNVFHYLPDPEKTLRDLKPLLKRHGNMVLLDYSKEGFFARYFEWAIKLIDQGHQKAYTLPEAESIVKNAEYSLHESEDFTINRIWKGWVVSVENKSI